MKRNIILACICAAIGFSACDSYLDVVPKGKAVLSTTEDYLGLMEPVDAEYVIDNFNYISNEQSFNNNAALETYNYPLVSSGFFWDEEYDRANNVTDDESLSTLYNKCYARIARYNILIGNMGDAEGPESDKKMGIAQAKVMRAYNYFFLLNTFAKPYNPATAATDNGIIVRDKFDLEAIGVQFSIADTYAFILKDMNEAIADLPEKSVNAYQPDRAFGYAARAKVHLFMRDIDNALSDALEVLKFSNHELWNLSGDFAAYINSMPGVAFLDDNTQYLMYRSAIMMTPHEYSHPENLLYCPNRTGGSPAILRKHLRETFDAQADLRYNIICNPTQPERPTSEPGGLYFMNSTILKLNESGIRLSEVYLMIAECYARKGNIELAMKYMNDLRKTRLNAKYYKDLVPADVDNDKDKALKCVREERARELFTSCNSFFDMRRFCTEFNETLTKTYTDTGGGRHTYTLKPDSHLLTFPFPIKAMQTTNLIQNSK